MNTPTYLQLPLLPLRVSSGQTVSLSSGIRKVRSRIVCKTVNLEILVVKVFYSNCYTNIDVVRG